MAEVIVLIHREATKAKWDIIKNYIPKTTPIKNELLISIK